MKERILSNKKHGMIVLLLTILLYAAAIVGTISFAQTETIAPMALYRLSVFGLAAPARPKSVGSPGSPGTHPLW